MSRIRVKICGITHPDDAILAAEAGADAIGIVFHPPVRRNVSVDVAREIIRALPPFVTPVGLFVDAPTQHVRDVAQELNLNHVQLNGHESPEHIGQLRHLSVLKAVRVERDRFEDVLAFWREAIAAKRLTNLRGLTLETAGTRQPGGTGVANDWETVRAAQQRGLFESLPPLIAAGGLTPETVGAVVRDIRPYAVDVSSGVEDETGRKSASRIADFIRAVRSAIA